MTKSKLAIIIGSVRQKRFADHVAPWIEDIARRQGSFEVELVDLKDYSLPFFAEPTAPSGGPSESEAAKRWQKKLGEFDAYLVTAAEYNHGPTSALKNALDYAFAEWGNKPIAFVGYGGVGGARAVEMLRLIAIALQMAPVRTAVHIVLPDYLSVVTASKKLSELAHLNQAANAMLDELASWSVALKSVRSNEQKRVVA
jgi:NAD(P)H-dependent FMN reductase